MNSSLLIATLFTTFVLFATLASAAKEKERRLLKGSAGATTNWAKKQHNNRHLKKTPHAAVCGNNNVEAGEECDGTDVTNCATDEYCNDCTCSPRCGNGIFDTGEECEDDNDCTANAGDFCHTDCTCKTPGCGNGVKEGSEECDDRNNVDGDGCSSTCTIEAGAVPAWLGVGGGAVPAAGGNGSARVPPGDGPGTRAGAGGRRAAGTRE